MLLQVGALEQDALEVLGLVRSMKNDFAPISRIPPDVFSLIPEYLEKDHLDENLITMTHVCRYWRELLIARSTLWVRLDCANPDQTRVYIERSKSAPLELFLKSEDMAYLEDGFHSVAPHIGRLKSLTIVGPMDLLRSLAPHVSNPLPLLRELSINLTYNPTPPFDSALFNGDLSSLHSLRLTGAITHLPWNNLSKITTFTLSRVSEDKISITQLLDFFEDAHHLRDVVLDKSIPTSSDAPLERVVPLPCLEGLAIYSDAAHSVLLNHLSIPAGASLLQRFDFRGVESPLLDFLPKTLENLGHIFPVTSVNLCFGRESHVELGGPNGMLHMHGHWTDSGGRPSFVLDRRILRSLSRFILSGTRRLAITTYESPTTAQIDKSAPYHILSRMKNLRTVRLNQCNNLPFILALDPIQNPLRPALCPKLEELVLYVKDLESFNIKELMCMAERRVLMGTKLSSITIVGLGELLSGEKVFKLKEYVTRVDYRVGEKPPRWDDVPEDGED